IHLRLASLYEEELRRDEDAIAQYKAVLQHAPEHRSALAGLGKLYHRASNWQGLLDVYEQELSAINDPRQKAARLYKAAEIEERIGTPEAAISRYQLSLQLQPGYLPSQQALTRLFEKMGRYADLIGLLDQDLQQADQDEQRIAALTKIAALYEDPMGDMDNAISYTARILELLPDNLPALRNLSRLYEKSGRFQDFIQAQETEAGLVNDTKQVIAIQHKNAEILEEQLRDRSGAISTYERILSLSPSYLPALKALGRLYAQDGRWDDLIKMYRTEAEIAPDSEQAAGLIFKIGELHERKRRSVDEAIAAYQEVLNLSPAYVPALRALARLYRANESWKALIDVLRAQASNRTDPQERANALFQAAAIWEEKLGRADTATEGYQEVLRLAPTHTAGLRALERLYTAQGDVRELATILEREAQSSMVPAAQVAAYSKLVRIYLDRMNEPARAAQCAEALLNLEPENLGALRTLERLRSSDKLRRAELRRRMADQITDDRLSAALRFSAATETEGPASGGVEALEQAMVETPLNTRITFSLDRALRHSHNHQGLAQLVRKQRTASTDPTERMVLSMRLADLHENRLSDLDAARDLYKDALSLNGQFLPALQGASRVAIKQGDFSTACTLLAREAEISKDAQSAIRAYNRAGRISLDSLNDGEAAMGFFKKALEKDPLDPTASTGLEDILASRGSESDLASLHERRGEAKQAAKDHQAAAAEFFNAAQRWRTQVDDPVRAVAAVDRALGLQPNHIPALEMKSALCETSGHFAEAAATLALRVQQGGEARTLSALHLKLGALYQEHLNDNTRASAHLQSALAADATNAEALERLARIHVDSRNWTGAADCLKRLMDLERRPEPLARHTLELAKIVDEGFGDPLQASVLYKRALELNAGDVAIVDRLAALYERTRNLPELIGILEQQAARSAELQKTLAIRMKIGGLYAGSVNDPARALATYRNVVEQDPENIDAHAALAELYARDTSPSGLAQAVDQHRLLLRLDPTRLESYRALFKIWEMQDQVDKAYAAACALLFFRSANDVETAYYTEHKPRVAQDATSRLQDADLAALMHPSTKGGLVDVLGLLGDQLSKIYPPEFEALGIDRKTDRLKPDHVVHKAIRNVAQVFGVEEFEVYQARRGLMTLETSEPLAVCVGQEVVRKFNAREQKFLIGRAVHGLLVKTAVLFRLTSRDRAKLFGSAVRVGDPQFTGLGPRDDAQEKQLRKVLSRKAIKGLEQLAPLLRRDVDVDRTVAGLACSADRAGLLIAGDLLMGLNMLMRQDPGFTGVVRGEGSQQVLHAVRTREDIKELLAFALSDDLFRLRQTVGLAVVP
ncbi:MAG: tetratricopeptide repeat protein, partial [Myxococcaceae bacterium]